MDAAAGSVRPQRLHGPRHRPRGSARMSRPNPSLGCAMRNGLLGGLLLLLTAGSAHAQPWPAPGWGYPGYPPMGYGPAYPPYTAPVPGYPLQSTPGPLPYGYPVPARPTAAAAPSRPAA